MNIKLRLPVYLIAIYSIAYCNQREMENSKNNHPIGFGFIKGKSIRLRENPSLDSNVIKIFLGGERILLLEKGSKQNIGSHTNYWYKIQITSNFPSKKVDTGWVFGEFIADEKNGPDALLEKVWSSNTSKQEKVKLLQFILENYINSEQDIAGGISFESYLTRFINALRCEIEIDNNPSSFGASSENDLKSLFLQYVNTNNFSELKKVSWCDVHINSNFECYPEGYYDHDLSIQQFNQISSFFINAEIVETGNNCFNNSKQDITVCIYSVKHNGRYFISKLCKK